jgi:hypothetical protein
LTLAALAVLALLSGAFSTACNAGANGQQAIAREQLFTLSYGPAEDQLDLFQVQGTDGSRKTRIAMRDGVFWFSNGNSSKVLRLSSYGDILSVVYNADRNPEPALRSGGTAGKTGRIIEAYPFEAPGEIAIDSENTLYVEDRMPPERRVSEGGTGASLEYAVLRFNKDGKFIDYLGQEGIGGTPFPFIQGIFVTESDDVVVISIEQEAWLVHWFDSRGGLRNSLKLPRNALPKPGGQEGFLASLDRVVPDTKGRAIILQVDYSREIVDTQTKSRSGIEYAGSWLYRMDLARGAVTDRWEIPPQDMSSRNSEDGSTRKYMLVPELLGVAGERFFFVTIDDDSHTTVSILGRLNKSVRRFAIAIAQDELYFNTMSLSRDGVISALLGSRYEARVVWWRFDKLASLGVGPLK